jgi:CsoR family transcriptional regulator, copper-sensing transcriptional repressor
MLKAPRQEVSKFTHNYYLTFIPPRGYICFMYKKESLIRRLKIVEGQVRGLQEMVEGDKYCIDVITQSSAIKQALSNLEDVLLEHHLSHCVVGQIKEGKKDKATDEILKVYRLKRK